jgi:hypothetical protein
MAAIAPQIEKFSCCLLNSRIFKPQTQLLFEAADKFTPAFKAANAFHERHKQAIKAAMPPAFPAPMAREV